MHIHKWWYIPYSFYVRIHMPIILQSLFHYALIIAYAITVYSVCLNFFSICISNVLLGYVASSLPKKATACLNLSLTQLTHQEILGVLETR